MNRYMVPPRALRVLFWMNVGVVILLVVILVTYGSAS